MTHIIRQDKTNGPETSQLCLKIDFYSFLIVKVELYPHFLALIGRFLIFGMLNRITGNISNSEFCNIIFYTGCFFRLSHPRFYPVFTLFIGLEKQKKVERYLGAIQEKKKMEISFKKF